MSDKNADEKATEAAETPPAARALRVAPQTAQNVTSAPQTAADDRPAPKAPPQQNAAPAQAGRDSGPVLRHPTQVRMVTTRPDLAKLPRQLNQTTIILPWNPDPNSEDAEVSVPPDGVRSLRTGVSINVAPGYEAVITCEGGEPGHRQPVAHLQGHAKQELILRFRNNGQATRVFSAGGELAQLTLRKLEPLDLALQDPHAHSDE